MTVPSLHNFMLPDGYVAVAVLDANLDSTSILCTETKDNKEVEIRFYTQEEVAIDAIEKYSSLQSIDNKEFKDSIVFPVFERLKNNTYYSRREFHPRTLGTLIYFHDSLYDEEKHIILLQIIKITSLFPSNILFPILPSRFLVYENLVVKFTDLHRPDPIDDESLVIGYYQKGINNETLILNIISQVWNLDDEFEAHSYYTKYKSLISPDAHSVFLVSDLLWVNIYFDLLKGNIKDIDSLPPVIRLDFYRHKLLDKNYIEVARNMILIYSEIDNLDQDILDKRVIPVMNSFSNENLDLISGLAFLILLKIKKRSKNYNETSLLFSSLTSEKESSLLQKSASKQSIKDYTDNSDKSKETLLLEALNNFFSPERKTARFLLCSQIHDIFLAEGEWVGVLVLQYLTSHSIDMELDILCSRIPEIVEITSNKVLTIKLLNLMKFSEQFYYALLQIPTSMYNPDILVCNFSNQLFTQTQVRFLIHVANVLTPELIFRLNLQSALKPPILSSLTYDLIKKIKPRINPIDFSVLTVNLKYTNNIIKVPPKMLSSGILNEISEMILPANLLGFRFHNATNIIRLESWKGSSFHLNSVKASCVCFTQDGKYLITAGEEFNFFTIENLKSGNIVPVIKKTSQKFIKHINCDSSGIYCASDFSFQCFKFENETMIPLFETHFCEKISTIKKLIDTNLLILFLEDGSAKFFKNELFHDAYKIPAEHGIPISVCYIPSKKQYVVGTDSGSLILFDLNMQCPVKILRLSNQPSYVSFYDRKSFLCTAGPYATLLNYEMNKIERCFMQQLSYVTALTSVNQVVITAHTDLTVRAWKDGRLINLLDGSVSTADNEYCWSARPTYTPSILSSKVKRLESLQNIPVVISIDEENNVYVWPLSSSSVDL